MPLDPITACARLAGTRGRVLLHSARNDDGLGRWSFVACEPRATLIGRGHSHVVLDANGRAVERFTRDPFEAAEAFLTANGCTLAPPTAEHEPEPRVAGYFGYDLARTIDRAAFPRSRSDDGARAPDLWLAAYGAVARVHPVTGELAIVGADADARVRLDERLGRELKLRPGPALSPLVADDDGDHHVARVERILDYLAAGDAYQVNLARRLVARVEAPGDALALYAAFAATAPAPYGGLIEADGVTLISGSPERFLAKVGDRIETRPIKGTRDRGTGARDELAASAKDAAEHLMIVDLERNDLGRIAEVGSVQVDDLGYIVELPALLHKVSRVSARPRTHLGFAELLRATFPGGSITGAPKRRAMQIIDELEPVRRGPYCGAFGYFGARGELELALAIRIGVLAGGTLHVHVGGGIVADSDPRAELAETELKALGWRQALERVRGG
jgi:para-aminobenzoate synthetase component 1